MLRTSFLGKTGFTERWLVWKKHFFVIFDPTWSHIVAPKSPNKEFLNILVKKDRNYIIINFVSLRLTREKEITENNQFFAIFEPNRAKFWPWCPLNLSFLAIIAINFHSGGFTTTAFCIKRYSPSKIRKNPR